MNCPSCKDVTLVMSERQGVEIDYCPQCRGVWLDRGELDKIIERSERELAAAAAAPQSPSSQGGDRHRWSGERDDRYREGHHSDYRRKSLWKEIFD